MEKPNLAYCDDHKECKTKLYELCSKAQVREERLSCVEEDIESIKKELWLNPNSLRQRIKGVEDADMHLEKIILDNRTIMQESLKTLSEDFNEKLKGMFKIFVLTITAASVLILGGFSLVYWEARSPKTVVVHKSVPVQQSSVERDTQRLERPGE